jgi:ribulose-5-phosphate 4-epimerase/fuculose-1-phosphate aldolase
VPLWHGGTILPAWDIRPFNKGRSGIVSTPALGKAMAEKLGRSEAVLLWGHGIAVTGSSLSDAVSRANDLRNTARMQEAVISMGGSWKSQAEAGGNDGASDRTWEYLKKIELKSTGGHVPTSPEPAPAKPTDPDAAIARDLVLANRILASDELGILDAFGHVSIRNPRNANSYFVAPGVAAGAVTARDVIQRDVTKPGNDSQGLSIDDEIYKARPDVMAVLYARTPEVVAFSEGSPQLRPVVNGGAFIGDGLPVFNVSGLDPKQLILSNPALGRGVAMSLAKKPGVLLSGHGFVLTARSVYNLVDQAYQLRMNAKIQQQTMALRGKVARLDERLAAPPQPNQPQTSEPPANAPQQPAAQLGPLEGRSWIYWSQNVPVD